MRISDWSSDVCSSDLITERARSSPTAKKQGRRRRSRASQLLATTSGPTPAGSPSATARGGRARASTVLPIVDNRVAAKVAQIALGAHAHPLLVELCIEDRKSTRLNSSH